GDILLRDRLLRGAAVSEDSSRNRGDQCQRQRAGEKARAPAQSPCRPTLLIRAALLGRGQLLRRLQLTLLPLALGVRTVRTLGLAILQKRAFVLRQRQPGLCRPA